MGLSLESELRFLLAYYGETASGPDALKPEDFFNLVLSFSSSLQVTSSLISAVEVANFPLSKKSAIEVYEVEKSGPQTTSPTMMAEAPSEPVSATNSSSLVLSLIGHS